MSEITLERTEEGAAGSAAAPENERGGKAANIIGTLPFGTLTSNNNNENEEKERAAAIGRRAASGGASSGLGNEAPAGEEASQADRVVYPSGGLLGHAAGGGNPGASSNPGLLESNRAKRRDEKRAGNAGAVTEGGGFTATSRPGVCPTEAESEAAWRGAADWGSECSGGAAPRSKAADAEVSRELVPLTWSHLGLTGDASGGGTRGPRSWRLRLLALIVTAAAGWPGPRAPDGSAGCQTKACRDGNGSTVRPSI